jgi:hypothetical protein
MTFIATYAIDGLKKIVTLSRIPKMGVKIKTRI